MVKTTISHYIILIGVTYLSSFSHAQEKLEFDDLENYQTNADAAMLNEIYQVAEQAKKEAQTWLDLENSSSHKKSTEQTSELTTYQDIETLQSSVNVDELIQSIQQDKPKVIAKSIPKEEQQDDIFKDIDEDLDTQKKSWFKRWKQNHFSDIKKEDHIHVIVENVPSVELKKNLIAKLGTMTTESLKDFNIVFPQIKKIANQAAQAVGYYDVDFGFIPSDDGRSLTVKMLSPTEPVRVKSQNIEFLGEGEFFPQFQVINILPDLEIDSIFDHGAYENTKTRINNVATNNGFFDGYWRLHDVKVTLPENTADINLKYETGARYKLGDVEFRMSDASKPLPIDEKILKEMITWKEGDNYADWRISLFSSYLINSRFFNSVSINEIKPDPIEKTLDLPPDLIDQIEKYQIDPNELAEQQAEQPIIDQDILDDTVESYLQNLTNQQVMLQERDKEQQLKQQARETQKIPVIVTLNADRPNSMELGVGYGTDTGFRTRMQYHRAFLNKMGHSFQSNLELSEIRQAGEARYYIPYHHPINRYFTLSGGYERESDENVGKGENLITETVAAGINYIMKSQRFDAWQHDFGLRYRLDRLTLKGNIDPSDIPDKFVAIQGTDTQESLLARYKASKIYANSPTNPTQGFRHHYQIELGSRYLLTDTDLAILSAGMSFIYSFGQNDNHQVIGRADGKYMFTNDFSKVPYNLRFFTGGDQSIRGFDYKSLSPKENGFKIGGQALAVGSLEYNYQIFDGWRLGVFSDFGNSFNEKLSNPLAYSIGLGVRWKSPVGPIRIDLASGISDENKPIRLHFFIGSPLQ